MSKKQQKTNKLIMRKMHFVFLFDVVNLFALKIENMPHKDFGAKRETKLQLDLKHFLYGT